MAVQSQTPHIEHIANGTTAGFNLGFDCDNQDHLIVLVDDIEPVVGTWSLSNGAVVFGTAPTTGKKITIQRNTPFERKRDYQSYDNSFRPPAVNKDFDRIWLKSQELGVADWLLSNKIQKFRDDVNLTALEETLEQAKEIRDATADSVIEVQSNVEQSQTLLADTTSKANQAEASATTASAANTAAQQALVQANAVEGNVYAALSAQTATVNTALVGFTNGASKWYATLALAEADIANITIKDKIDIGEIANGGTWYKATAGATSLTKSPYDPVEAAKLDATTKANAAEANANTLTLDKTKNIKLVDVDGFAFGLADADDKVFLLIDASGEIIVTNLEGSVQSAISKLKQSLDVTDAPFALGFNDKNDRLLGYFKNNSELMLSGLSESVQSSVNHLLHRQDDIMRALNQHEVILSKHLLPSDFNVNSSQVLASTVNIDPQAIQYLPISTPYRKNDSLVHPNVIELDEPMRGFKYWMCLTPYQGNNILEENPCVYGSNDLEKWELIDGMPQPLDNPPDWDEVGTGAKGYLSDCWWVYDHINKELVCCWRKAYTVGDEKYNNTDVLQLLARSTKNGLVWSEPFQIYKDTLYGSDALISPSIVFDQNTNKWCMIYMRGADIIYMRTSDNFKNSNGWSEPIDLKFGDFKRSVGSNMVAWHFEVKFLGDRLYGLITDTVNMAYYLCRADKTDLTQWTYTTHNLLPTRPSGRPSLYKASFVADNIDSNSLQIRLFFTAGNTAESRLFTHLSNEISID